MFKLFFEILTDPLGLPINALWEYLILAIINVVAFNIAWDASPGGTWGSTIHWAVRLVAFVIIWAVTYGIIALAKWHQGRFTSVRQGVNIRTPQLSQAS